MSRTRSAPTTRTYRDAVRAIVTAVQRRHDLTDAALAERIGCSAGTVRNAKAEHTNLDGVTLATLEHRFGSGTLDPFLALGGSRAIPLPEALPDIDPVLDIVAALHKLIAAQHMSSDEGYLITSKELLAILRELRDARLAFDTLIMLAGPGLAAASPDVRRWFRSIVESPEDASDRQHAPPETAPASLAAPPAPADFADAAAIATPVQLAERYGVSTGMIGRWLLEVDERLLNDGNGDA